MKKLKNKIDEMQEEVVTQPKGMHPFLPFEIQPTDQAVAQQQLLQRWNIAYQPITDGNICEFALTNQLACDIETGDWQSLKKIDRPVILTLSTTTGQPIYGVLVGMNEDNVVINFSGREMLLNKAEVSSYWNGEYFLLWQMPPSYQGPISIWMQGTPVQWLVSSLAKLENVDLIVPPTTIFDRKLKTTIEEFQTQHSLEADGIVGPHTLIILNGLINENIPNLSMQGSAS